MESQSPTGTAATAFTLVETLDVLERTPAVLDRLLRGTSPAWHRADEGAETWSPFDVVGHLIHAEETNWVPRAQRILEQGGSQAFEPFDRFAHLTRFREEALGDLLDRFADVRQTSLDTVRSWHLTEQQLVRRGRHPALGTVTLQELLATWAVHDLAHIGQVARVMAKRYTAAVGPWREYLSILNR